MERETRTIETPLGHKVAIKTFFTQSERVQVQRILAGENTASEEAKQSALIDASHRALTLAVVSIDGDASDVLEKLTDELPTSEYDAVLAPVLEMIRVDLATAK